MYAEFCSNIRHAGLITHQQNLHIGAQVLPGLDGIALDSGDVRVSKGFGRGENGKEGFSSHIVMCWRLAIRTLNV